MKRHKLLFLGLAALFIVAMVILIPLKADTNKGKESRLLKADEETLKLVKTIQVWSLVTNVSLSEEQLVSFLPVFNEQGKLKWKFRHGKYRAIEALRTLDKKDNVPDARLRQAVDNYYEIEDEFTTKMRKLDETLMSKLTPRQQVKYILFKDSYQRDLRQTLLKIRELGKKEKQPVIPSQSTKPKKDN